MAIAGLQDNSGMSMFEHLTLDMKPSSDDMEKQAEQMRFNKVVKTKEFYVKTFDLGDAKKAKEYAATMLDIYAGVQARTHVILFNERKFVVSQTGDNPRWVAHIEWAVYELITTVNESVKSASEGVSDGNDAKAQ